jgi:hypothetical protein
MMWTEQTQGQEVLITSRPENLPGDQAIELPRVIDARRPFRLVDHPWPSTVSVEIRAVYHASGAQNIAEAHHHGESATIKYKMKTT